MSDSGFYNQPNPPSDGGASRRPNLGRNLFPQVVGLILALAVLYGFYFWVVRRVVVPSGQVLVLVKKDGHRSLPSDQIIIPRAPDAKDAAAYTEWEKKYRDCNGILEEVFGTGTYFGFSPFDYEREIVPLVVIDQGKVGIVVKKFGETLAVDQVIADEAHNQRGPLARTLQPGTYYEFSNPYAYEVKEIDPISIDPGHRGVVTVVAGAPTTQPNAYLVEAGEQGVQKVTETEGRVFVNPFVKRITSIQVQSQNFQMTGTDSIRFPSSDSFEIRMEGFVEWSIIPDKLPLIYVQYAEGGELIAYLKEKVILPYSRSFSRLVGSQYMARDFISGETRLKFQEQFETKLREACAHQGINILQARVRDIVPPDDIKQPINEREIAKQQIKTIEQQIQVAKSSASLATQTEMGAQNQAIGNANKEVVTIVKKAQQERDVAITKAQQDLAVAKLRLEAAQKQADALIARGQSEANVILLQKQAEAQPLADQVKAFGDGNTYAQYFFYQKIAPSIKSILTNTDGPFADVFRQFAQPSEQRKPEGGAK